jgi:hypothetical protein
MLIIDPFATKIRPEFGQAFVQAAVHAPRSVLVENIAPLTMAMAREARRS